jgi:hypothetical protein
MKDMVMLGEVPGSRVRLRLSQSTGGCGWWEEIYHPVSMAGAPKGCSINELGANPLAAADTKKLTESFFSGLSPGYDFGVKLASRIYVACP